MNFNFSNLSPSDFYQIMGALQGKPQTFWVGQNTANNPASGSPYYSGGKAYASPNDAPDTTNFSLYDQPGAAAAPTAAATDMSGAGAAGALEGSM
jgi:hypothetical protein